MGGTSPRAFHRLRASSKTRGAGRTRAKMVGAKMIGAVVIGAVVIGAVVIGALMVACSPKPEPSPTSAPLSVASARSTRTAAPSATPASATRPTPTPSTPTPSTPTPGKPPSVNAAAVLRDVEHLAGDIGPREATSANFREAADFVEARLAKLGYEVHRTTVRVPAGNSWGTPVRAGHSANVIADPRGFDDTSPHVVIGAHLDTVAVAPGAEDNASGVSVLLELARLAAATPPHLPVRFIAFGAEEPRGSGDALHHFGSQQLVVDLSRAERRAIRGMVALDRVGVRASYVPVCLPPNGEGRDLQRALRAAARRVEVPTRACGNNTTSDHWSYAKAGISAVRLGGIPYAGYHSRGDVPKVVDRRQLDRVTTVMWEWLNGLD